MRNVLIAGAGKIGSTIARFLHSTGDYAIYITDVALDRAHAHATNIDDPHFHLMAHNALEHDATLALIKKHSIDMIVSCLPYTGTTPLAELAKKANVHYFGLTEDIISADTIAALASHANKAFVPQCGLAPGFINIIASHLIRQFNKVDVVKLRCGALPIHTSNPLQYALTWSTDGLINEYANTCYGIIGGKKTAMQPLEDLEELRIDDAIYEAFNTSGGIGSLIESYLEKVQELTYKSIRYPGHCEKMRFLMEGLKLKEDRHLLKKILENALPAVMKDVVIVYVSVNGKKNKETVQETYVNKFYPETIANITCSAMQATTASSACAAIDMVVNHPEDYCGLIKQEDLKFPVFINNRF